ncbi:MAG: sensor histidine kinase [Anaerolineae bacterium]|nr:sensor histidine kinase [Anaerolineae bacterium]
MTLHTLPPSESFPAPPDVPMARSFDGGSKLVLAVVLGLIFLAIAQKAYRLSLPTDGWSFYTGEIDSADQDRPIYQTNLLGQPSPLRQGDRFLAVEDRTFEAITYDQAMRGQIQPLANWQAGQTVRYTVERGGQPLVLPVPLYTWPLTTVLQYILTSPTLWASIVLAAVGWFVFLKRPDDGAARALLLFTNCLFVNSISAVMVDWGLPEMVTPGILTIATFFSNWIFATVMFPSLLLLTLLFPQPKPFVQRHPRPVIIGLYSAVPLLIVLFGPIAPVGWIAVLVMALLSLVAIGHALFTVRDPVSRAQMRWAVGGLLVLVLGFIPINLSGLGWLPFPFPPWLEAIWFPLMLVVMALGFGVAILRYRLFDIDILINRALVYGALTACVVSLYIFVVGYLSAVFRVEDHQLISLAAAGVVAVLFQPLREWLQRGVNRLMYGQRNEPVAVLSQVGARLESDPETEALLPGLAHTIAQALKLPYVAITLQNDGTATPYAEIGQAGPEISRFPLTYQGDIIGHLLVAPRAPGENFNAADHLLLTNIARQTAAAAHTLQLAAALQESRQQLVTAREEERRRLRRDLHDGLGPQLASQMLTIDAITKLLERDPAQVRELLQHLKRQSQTAIHDIRRLVYNLRPPALDELGLVMALRESSKQFAQNGPVIRFTISPDPLPPLPAAVEVAVYRIVQEALTNVARHAQAQRCRVGIAAQNHHLELTIGDDGRGFPADYHYGVGLNSMRERAEEVGGQFTLINSSSGGAEIAIRLPLSGE